MLLIYLFLEAFEGLSTSFRPRNFVPFMIGLWI
jgi:hypothetical protein